MTRCHECENCRGKGNELKENIGKLSGRWLLGKELPETPQPHFWEAAKLREVSGAVALWHLAA